MLDRLLVTGGTHLVPIVEAVSVEGALVIIAGKQRFDAPKRGIWIALICDDLHFAGGPAAFHLKSRRKLLERATAIFIISGPAVPEAYAAAADIAAAGANVLIVETQEGEETSWMDFVRRHAPRAAISLVNPAGRKSAA